VAAPLRASAAVDSLTAGGRVGIVRLLRAQAGPVILRVQRVSGNSGGLLQNAASQERESGWRSGREECDD
jgi:hypothetical protein